jgi:hypothetical protein
VCAHTAPFAFMSATSWVGLYQVLALANAQMLGTGEGVEVAIVPRHCAGLELDTMTGM